MARRFVDLSMTLCNDVVSDPPFMAPRIEYQTHGDTRHELDMFFPEVKTEEMRGGDVGFAAIERVTLTTHNGTHVDAPWHYHPQQDGALGDPRQAMTIDEMPLDWFFQRGVKLDFRHFADGHVVTAAEVEAELERIGHVLAPLDIVVVNTSAGKALAECDPAYVNRGCGMGYAATMYLLERGVRVTGTDAWSWDAPFAHTRANFEESGDARLIWEGHRAGADIGYCHIEKLHNLEAIPANGFMISCFPHKIKGASAGWTRAVAIFED